MQATVLRELRTSGGVHQPGEVIDVTGWHNVRAYVEQGCIELAGAETMEAEFRARQPVRGAGGKIYAPGEIVDVTGWHNIAAWIAQGYIEVLVGGELLDQEVAEASARRRELRQVPVRTRPEPDPSPRALADGWPCADCGKVCKTKAGLGAHRAKVHR